MMMTTPVFHRFKNASELHLVLAKRVAGDLQEAIRAKGHASLMLSGGNTPKPFLQQLSRQPLAWEKVTIGLVDERWVDPTEATSNEHLVRTHLLRNEAVQAVFIGMKQSMATAADAAETVGTLYAPHAPFDVIVLGMGNDGHTASLFPHRPELMTLTSSEAPLCGAAVAPVEPYERMTLSLDAITSSHHCYLHIEGRAKENVYTKALSGDAIDDMPIRAVLKHGALETYFAKES